MNKKMYTISIFVAVLLLLGCLCTIGIFVIKGNSSSSYEKHIQVAQQCFDKADYEGAIEAYEEAINDDDKNVEAYVGIAKTYRSMNDIQTAISWLTTGYELTGDATLQEMLNDYTNLLGQTDRIVYTIGEVVESSADVTLNTDVLTAFSNYTYDDYSSSFSSSEGFDNTEISFDGIPAVFSFASSTPELTDKPVSISMTSISYIFNEFTKGISCDRLNELGLENISFGYDETLGMYLVTFDCDDCHVEIETDEEGNIVTDEPYNTITFAGSTSSTGSSDDDDSDYQPEEGYCLLKGTAYNEMDESTEKVTIKIYSGKEADKKNIIYDEDTSSNGKYRAELVAGEYYIEVYLDDNVVYSTEHEIKEGKTLDKLDLPYAYSKEFDRALREGEILITLSWDNSDGNLDHELTGVDSEGNDVYCCHSEFNSGNHKHYLSDVLVVSSGPEVDGGPEEVTVYDLAGTYYYSVNTQYGEDLSDYDNVKVEVYIAGSSGSVVFNMPENMTGSTWNVFEYVNGEVNAL
ncbi:MAG: tetratricopeptide repeat protein [Ruminococcus sp.]|nr:tetratricopeptide repeat protein [Ruminococcus sp.]